MAFRFGVVLGFMTLLVDCRGQTSKLPPVHLNPNMDEQARFDPQEPNPFFADGRAMRLPLAGTVPHGMTADEEAAILREDEHFFAGLQDGKPALTMPLPLNRALLERGRQRFEIYCTPCHGAAGVGGGIVTRRGMVEPPNFDDRRLLAMPIGQIFQIVSQGARNMPSYAAQIPVADRWAIAAYFRALQHTWADSAAVTDANHRGETP